MWLYGQLLQEELLECEYFEDQESGAETNRTAMKVTSFYTGIQVQISMSLTTSLIIPQNTKKYQDKNMILTARQPEMDMIPS